MSHLDKISDIYDHISKGTALDAFEKYYAEDVSMILEDGTKIDGKDANLQREKEFFSSVEEFHGIDISGITSNEEKGITAVESKMTVTFKGTDKPTTMEQVAVQHWEDEKISTEQFYAVQNG